jgi:hypothetical protein
MPTAILQTVQRGKDGNKKVVSTTKTITHNNARLYHEGGLTYEYVGADASGNRIYRNTKPR